MRKALARKGFALFILLAFVAAMGTASDVACKKSVDEAKMYANQAADSAAKVINALWDAKVAAADAKAPADMIGAAAADRVNKVASAAYPMKTMRS
jgi:hypothetical protein